ncbi:MAG TPA: sulfite exporter TauE/SafE family protein [Pseudonocardiaceae bacterium]
MSTALLLAGLIVVVGSVVQGVVGLGLNLVAAPLLVLLDPALVPVPMLLVAALLSGLTMIRERGHADWRGVGWALAGRTPGTAIGVLAVVALPERWFGLVVGLSVLVCVGLSVIAWRPRPTPRSLLVAGLASGVTGTAASIGGPPVAIVYQHSDAPQVRATLGAYFAIGSVVSLGALALAGEVGGAELVAAAWLAPFLLGGYLVSGPARKLLDANRLRPALLTVSAGGALLLVVRALV